MGTNLMNGFVIGEKDTLPEWGRTVEAILKCCHRIWDIVKVILCVDSPEGCDFVEIDDEDFDLGSKETLSFSWRVLKEARYVL